MTGTAAQVLVDTLERPGVDRVDPDLKALAEAFGAGGRAFGTTGRPWIL